MEDVKAKVKVFLSRFFSKHELGVDEDIFSLGFVNSFFAMQLVIFIEEEFRVRIGNKDLNLDNFRTINRIASLIEGKMN